MKRSPWKRKPYTWKRSTTPMNKVGRQGKLNAKADKETKAKLEKEGIDYCQLCGRNINLSRSHSYKKRYRKDRNRIALLCIDPCHKFIEERLDAETRTRVNDYIMDSTLEGEFKFAKIVEMIPEDRREEFVTKILRQI
jgi:hypothetical protein